MAREISPDDVAMAKDFEQEAREMLDRCDENLKLMSEGDWSHENLLALFRTAHSLKGVSGMLGLSRVVQYVHKLENLMSRFLSGDAKPVQGDDVLLMTSFGALRDLLRSEVGAAVEGRDEGDPETAARADSILVEIVRRMDAPGDAGASARSETSAQAPSQATEPVGAVADSPGASASNGAADGAQGKPKAAGAASSRGGGEKTIRVDAEILDRLLNLVGELVVAKNKLRHMKSSPGASGTWLEEIEEVSRDVEYFSSEIQRAVMRMRLVPIRSVFSKIPRIAAETSKLVGKPVDVHLEGADTEIDKGLVDSLLEPLVHIIRNSVDHGLEPAEARRAKGKPERGQIRVRARQDLDKVIVEVEDDGGGIPGDKVARKAVEKGLISAEAAAAMKDQEKVELVFLPGFSTADKLSEVSGRGVGMDVVRTTLRQIGGDVSLRSKQDVGTVVTLETPAKTGIKEALLVADAGSVYAIPVEQVAEAVKFAENLSGEMSGGRVYRYRGQLIGLRPLWEILGFRAPSGSSAKERKVLVVQKGAFKFGIVVDSILAKQQILIKDVPAQMKRNPIIKAATYLWDGKEILVLDPVSYLSSLTEGARLAS